MEQLKMLYSLRMMLIENFKNNKGYFAAPLITTFRLKCTQNSYKYKIQILLVQLKVHVSITSPLSFNSLWSD